MKITAAVIFIISVFSSASFAQSVSLTPIYSLQNAKQYDGSTQGANLDVKTKKHKMALLYEHRTRDYSGNEINDNVYGASYTYVAKRFYIENNGYWTEKYLWLPKYSVTTAPHYVWDGHWDTGISFNYKEYPTENYSTISPSLGRYFDSFFVRAQENITMGGNSTIYSTQGLARYYIRDDLYVELNGATGKTTEDQGVVETFHDIGFATKFHVVSRMNMIIQGNAHRSETIHENSLGFTLEFRL